MISVIVPVYNVEKYLDQCIDSIVNQTYKYLEIILVDDGSTDGSGRLCDIWALKDNRIKVIHQDNKGPSTARNTGLRVATGEYIAFLDSDDWVHLNFLEILYRLCKDKQCNISQCALEKVWSEKDVINLKNVTNEQTMVFSGRDMIKRLYEKEGWRNVVLWNKLYRKEAFSDIQFPLGKEFEDEFLTWRIFWKTERVVTTELQLYYYRQRNDSLMGSGFSLNRALDKVQALEERTLFFKTVDAELFDLSNSKLRWFYLMQYDDAA